MDPFLFFLKNFIPDEAPSSAGSRFLTEGERVLEKVKSLLNWLTRWNFEIVKDQLIETITRTPSLFVLKGLVNCIFDMAEADEAYNLFGRLCSKLNNELPSIPSDERDMREITFRRLLLNKCQMEFEIAVCQSHLILDDEERIKLRLLGTLRLLAELFKHKMIIESICQRIIQALLKPACPPELNIEAIYQFCTSIGKQVDMNPRAQAIFDTYFSKLNELATCPQLTSRSRVLIFNLLNLRANNWVNDMTNIEFQPEEDEDQELFSCATATTSNGTLHRAEVIKEEPESEDEAASCEEDNYMSASEAEDMDNNIREQLKQAMAELTILKQEACEERRGRIVVEKDADEAIRKAEMLESKYSDELKRRKETEDALAREKEEMEKVKLLLEVYAKERDELKLERDNALKITEDLLKNQDEETSLLSLVQFEERQTPSSFICPISQEVMKDPHVAADGFTYEAEAVREWLSSGRDTSPMTNLELPHCNLVPNRALRSAIQEWLQEQR